MTAPHLTFRVQARGQALPLSEVQELLPLPWVQPTEGRPEGVLGVFMYRGAVLPVLDLAHGLGLDGGPARPDEHLVVLRREGAPSLALRVGALEGVATLEPADWDPALAETLPLRGLATHDGSVYHLLDTERLEAMASGTPGGPAGDLWERTFGALPAETRALLQGRSGTWADLDAPETGHLEVVSFELGGERFALPAAEILGIHPCPPLQPLPGAPPALLGCGPHRGDALLVADLRPLLGMAAAPPEPEGRVLVVEDAERPLGIYADRADLAASLDPAGRHPVAEGPGAPFLLGTWTRDGLPLTLLSLPDLLAAPDLGLPDPS